MGNCSCFYAQKLQKYKHMYPTSTKFESSDPRLKDSEFLNQQIKKLDYIIKHQNLDLARLQQQNDKLRADPRNQAKVLNNSKKLHLLTRNGLICKFCLQKNDTNKVSIEQLVNMNGLCGPCKGEGLHRTYQHVKSKQCGVCDTFYEYLWKIQLCNSCNGVGLINYMNNSPYQLRQAKGQHTEHQFAQH